MSEQANSKSRHWANWPIWQDDSSFQTPNFQFRYSMTDYTGKSNSKEIVILKDRHFLNIYKKLALENDFQNIFEVGFFQGGMPIFLADMLTPKKIVAIDWKAPSAELNEILKSIGLDTSVEFVGNVDQAKPDKLRSVVESQFGVEPLDLIIDDCSHYYAESKSTLENLFGYLKPGGKYVLEDWGWTHWPGDAWQTSQSHFHGMTSLSNLVFEIVMAYASNPSLFSAIEIHQQCVIITRGEYLSHGAIFNFDKIVNVAGNRDAKLIVSNDTKTQAIVKAGFRKVKSWLRKQ